MSMRVIEECVGHVRLQDRLQLLEERGALLLISGRARGDQQLVDLGVVVAVRVPWALGVEEVPVAVVRIGVGDAAVDDPVEVAGQPPLVPGGLLQLLDLDVETEIDELVAENLGGTLLDRL